VSDSKTSHPEYKLTKILVVFNKSVEYTKGVGFQAKTVVIEVVFIKLKPPFPEMTAQSCLIDINQAGFYKLFLID